MTEKQLKTNLLNIDVWIRLIYMVVFGLLLAIARTLIWVVAVIQFLLVLVTAGDSTRLRDFGLGLGKWVYQGVLFLTFNTEQKPFPFSDWPEAEQVAEHKPAPAGEAAADQSEPVDVAAEPVAELEQPSDCSGEAEVELPEDEFEPVDDDDVPSFTDDADKPKS